MRGHCWEGKSYKGSAILCLTNPPLPNPRPYSFNGSSLPVSVPHTMKYFTNAFYLLFQCNDTFIDQLAFNFSPKLLELVCARIWVRSLAV